MVPLPICVGSRESLYAYPLYCIYGISGSRLSPLGWTKAPALSYLRVHAVDRFIFLSQLWRWSWWCEQHYWHNDIAWLPSCCNYLLRLSRHNWSLVLLPWCPGSYCCFAAGIRPRYITIWNNLFRPSLKLNTTVEIFSSKCSKTIRFMFLGLFHLGIPWLYMCWEPGRASFIP